jgi:glycine cleavage system aminomethyltransferase T
VLLHELPARYLLLVPAVRAGAAWHALVAAGRPLELSCVGIEALERLAAAPG